LRWVEKTPYNEYYADDIFAWWPDANCIHIVRDPRDNFSSYQIKQPDWGPISFARSWRESTQRGWKNQQRYGKRRYLLIRYEDLVEEPEQTIAEIIEFLNIEDDPILRQPTRNGQSWGGNSMFGERFEGVSRNPIGRYKSQLDQDTIATLEASLFPEMDRLGYGLKYAVDASVRLRWFVSRIRWLRQGLHSSLAK
ncbi:MAG: sulfotransferase, partial [Anaerolineales bacterium]|nr:sulfotransferase [Anaerolineales bacterium]